ncbi:MAG: hypothetical protein MUF19_02075 [Candidatus Pacebacteria bacterium]|jgi:hypothetical protein|nr:hypothetical protein [Candidatus Paceibacterota bacterium]
MKSYRTLIILGAFIFLLSGYGFMSASWTAPSGTPPNSNTDAPINVGVDTQAKAGNFMANIVAAATSTWSPEYCDELGNNCWDPSLGPPGGGGGDTITVGGRCFEPAWAVTCNWNWSGDGNDNSMYIRPISVTPSAVCSSVGRSYQYHSMIFAECSGPATYSWQTGAYGSCSATSYKCGSNSGVRTRTVSCVSTTGTVVADSNCTGTKPATTVTCSNTPCSGDR